MSGSSSKPTNSESNDGSKERTEWELRPGGMVVQKRDDGVSAAVPMIKINVSHGSSQHEITVPAQSTFGELKRVLAQETGLEPQEQRLLFRGKEKENDEWLHAAGVKDMSKVVLLEEPASKEKKLEQMKRDEGISMACEAVARVRAEVDKLAEKISSLESAVHGGTKVEEKEFAALTELLMLQLLKLDGIEAEGEAKAQRKIEIFHGAHFDFSWGDAGYHQGTLEILKTAVKSPKKLCADIIDTVGPELQVVNKSETAISLEADAFVVLTPDQGQEASSSLLPINFGGLAKAVKPGDTIFIGQYLFTGSETTFVWLEVVELKGDDVVCAIKNTATLAGSLFTLHISQVRIDLPTLSEADKDQIFNVSATS